MRTTYKVLAYVLAAEVLVQAMAIAFAIAGLGKWVDDGHSATKALFDNENADFGGKTGFIIHGINGQMVIPLVLIALLIVSFFAKIPGGTKRAGILFGLVALQVTLGIMSHSIPGAIIFHALNAFVIFSLAAVTGYRLRAGDDLAGTPAMAGAAAV